MSTLSGAAWSEHAKSSPAFFFHIGTIPANIQRLMQKAIWYPGCPVTLSHLAYLQLSFWGFDQRSHIGILIVNTELASDAVAIFQVLYQNHFPIAEMKPMYFFHGNDLASMTANNTTGFQCRSITDSKNFSEHAYGRAIDINPLINPYIKGRLVEPSQGKNYIQRNKSQPGIISHSSVVYQIFHSLGWQWGGDWHTIKDYQHFEKAY
jgi:hypothetical protein